MCVGEQPKNFVLYLRWEFCASQMHALTVFSQPVYQGKSSLYPMMFSHP